MEQIDPSMLFDLPDGWEWCSLSNIAQIDLGKTLNSIKNTGTLYPYLRSANVKWGSIDMSSLNSMRFEECETERYSVIKNDLLLCEGGDVGRSAVWESEATVKYQNALRRVRFHDACDPYYFMYYMMYYESKGILKHICKGVTIKHLTSAVLVSIPFALPPIGEQRKITRKIKQFFYMFDSIVDNLS